MSVALRPYQDEALAALDEARDRGVKKALVALPTGTGKTLVFSSLIQRRGGTALILAHRDELLRQAADKLTTVAPELGMSVGFVKAREDDTNAPVVIASVQTLGSDRRLSKLPAYFNTVIVDEAHHATAPTYRKILDYVDADQIVGVTATPERADKDRLTEVFDELVYGRSLLEMIEQGYLANLQGLRVELDDFDLSTVKVSRGDYQANDLGRALEEAGAPDQVAAALVEYAPDRKSIVFVPTVALAAETARAIDAAGIPAGHVDGGMAMEDRQDVLSRFATGDLRAVVNVDVLTEGYDEPSVDCVAIAAPTRSRISYVQRVGRGTRLYPGKQDCLVLDLVGVSDDLKLQSLPALFDLSAPPRPGETVSDAIARELETAEAEAHGEHEKREAAERRRTRAKDASLFNRDRLHWLTHNSRWYMEIGGGQLLVLDPVDEKHWQVLRVRDTGAKTLARGLDLGYAQGAAEEAIRGLGKAALVDSEAPWRARPVSGGQRGMLRHLGVDAAPETMGEASDLIAAAKAEEMLDALDAALAAREMREAVPA